MNRAVQDPDIQGSNSISPSASWNGFRFQDLRWEPQIFCQQTTATFSVLSVWIKGHWKPEPNELKFY